MMSHNIAQYLSSVNEISLRLSSDWSVAHSGESGNLMPLHEIASTDFVNHAITQ